MRIFLMLIASAGLASCVGDIESNARPAEGNDGNGHDRGRDLLNGVALLDGPL